MGQAIVDSLIARHHFLLELLPLKRFAMIVFLKSSVKSLLIRVAPLLFVLYFIRLIVSENIVKNESLKHEKLFIAIGTNPSSVILRNALRSTWIRWAEADHETGYKFFTEMTDDTHTNNMLRAESNLNSDMVFQDIKGGYNNFFDRGIFQMEWALNQYSRMQYYLRVDDDSFLCFQKFKYELIFRPNHDFFWGKYFCKPRKHCADENFMLFTTDLVKKIVHGVETKQFEVRRNNTLARNFGMWSQDWVNLKIFDDRNRFDVQQGLLTEYMHMRDFNGSQEISFDFCTNHIYAHWVKNPEVMRRVFAETKFRKGQHIPEITSKIDGCADPRNRTIEWLLK